MRLFRFQPARRFAAVTAALALTVSLSACNDDDNDGSSGSSPTPTPATSSSTATPTKTVAPGSTATPTRSNPGPTATATATPKGSQQDIAKVEAVVASVLPQVLNLQSFGALAGGGVPHGKPRINVSAPCPAGGTLTFGCNASGSGSKTEITFNTCKVGATGVASTTLNGTFSQTITTACFTVPPANSPLSVSFKGSINTTDPTTNQPLSIDIDMSLTIKTDSTGTTLDFDGTVNNTCAGSVKVTTLESLKIATGASCPNAGRIRIKIGSATHEVSYSSSGGVSIDVGADGSVDKSLASCRDAESGSC